MFLLQALVALPQTFGELAEKVMKIFPSGPEVHFVADTYKVDSIKSTERSRRGEGEAFLLKGPSTKIPRDWRGFLKHGHNKNQLAKFLLSEWSKNDYANVLHSLSLLNQSASC